MLRGAYIYTSIIYIEERAERALPEAIRFSSSKAEAWRGAGEELL